MLAKISVLVYLLAGIMFFTNGQMALFWLSVALLLITAGLSLAMSCISGSTQLKKYQEPAVDESKLQYSPLWMVLVTSAGVIASFVLLAVGILGKM